MALHPLPPAPSNPLPPEQKPAPRPPYKLKLASLLLNGITMLLGLYLAAAPHAVITKLYVVAEQGDPERNKIVRDYLEEVTGRMGNEGTLFLSAMTANFLVMLILISRS